MYFMDILLFQTRLGLLIGLLTKQDQATYFPNDSYIYVLTLLVEIEATLNKDSGCYHVSLIRRIQSVLESIQYAKTWYAVYNI